MSEVADEFRNDSGGILGVVKKNAEGKLRGTSVGIGETVWLDQQEQVATANAPKRPENNPFTNGNLTLVTEKGEIENRRPLRPDVETPVEASEPPQGEQAEGEVNATETAEAEAAKERAEAKKAAVAESAKAQQAAAAKAAAQRSIEPKEPAAKPATPAPAPVQQKAAPQGSRPATEAVGTPAQAG